MANDGWQTVDASRGKPPARSPAGNRSGGGGGKLSKSAVVNKEIIASRSAGEILAIVKDRGDSLNAVNVSTAVNMLSKVARPRDGLRRDPRYKRLLELVRSHCGAFGHREVANVVHGLGVLCANKGAGDIDAKTADLWMRASHREAPKMNPQEISNVLNALGKLDAAAAAVSPEGWLYFAKAVERESVEMNAQEVSNTLNAYAEMRKRRPQASAAVTEAGWQSLAAATTRTTPTMTNQDIALTVDAAKKLDAFASAIDDKGWEILAAAVVRMAPNSNPQNAVIALSAVGWKRELARSLNRQGGFDALIGSIERNIDAIRRGYPPDFQRYTYKTLDAIRLIYEHDEGAYGNERLERLRIELQTKPGIIRL